MEIVFTMNAPLPPTVFKPFKALSRFWSSHKLFGQRRCLASSPRAHRECSQYSQCATQTTPKIHYDTGKNVNSYMLRLEALFHKFHVGTMFISDLLPESQANPRPTPTARVSKKQNKNTMFLVTASKAQDMKHWTRLKTRYIQVLNVCIQGVIDSKVFWVGSSFIFLTLPLAPSFDFRFPIGLRKENPNGTGSSPKVQRTAQLHWLQTDKTINVDAVNLSARSVFARHQACHRTTKQVGVYVHLWWIPFTSWPHWSALHWRWMAWTPNMVSHNVCNTVASYVNYSCSKQCYTIIDKQFSALCKIF